MKPLQCGDDVALQDVDGKTTCRKLNNLNNGEDTKK